jgi:uncharacterized protein YdhG (YjbR/CyaY superfamily)
VDEYIAMFPAHVQNILERIRRTIQEAVPEAKEKISYQIPTFTLSGNLVHFAAWKNHIAFYPGSRGIKTFRKELSPYGLSKGTIRFPMDKPIPLQLVRKIVKYRVKENFERGNKKTN